MDGNLKDRPVSPPAGIGFTSDVRTLKESGTASVAELREFLKSLKARNPQEVIGIVSSNLLVQSLGLACVITAVFMVVFTVGPYMVYGPMTSKGPPKKPAAPTVATDGQRANSEGNAGAGASANGAASTGQPDAERASKAMGLDEAKPADPKKNPLDKPDIDKLLDGL